MPSSAAFKANAEQVAEKQRDIQRKARSLEAKHAEPEQEKKAIQTGQRE